MNVEADALLLQGVDQLRSEARKVYAETLNAVVNLGINGFNNGVATTVVDINGGDASSFHIVEEAAVAHAANSCVAGSDGGSAVGIQCLQATITENLPAKKQRHADG